MTNRDLTFRLDRIETPVGHMLVFQDALERLRALDWEDYGDSIHRVFDRHYGKGAVTTVPGDGGGPVVEALRRYLAGDLGAIDSLDVETAGTEFQQQVWRTLRTIPCGQTWSYGELAQRVGRPTAFRAVGAANGANPVGIVVPCHRVIGSNNDLTGYGGGLERKRWLLAHEGALIDEPRQLALV